jgi:hypothetical protein
MIDLKFMGGGWRNRGVGQALRLFLSKKRCGGRLIFKIGFFGA